MDKADRDRLRALAEKATLGSSRPEERVRTDDKMQGVQQGDRTGTAAVESPAAAEAPGQGDILAPWAPMEVSELDDRRAERCWANGAVAAHLYWSGYRWCSWVMKPTGRRLDYRDDHATEAEARAHADDVLQRWTRRQEALADRRRRDPRKSSE